MEEFRGHSSGGRDARWQRRRRTSGPLRVLAAERLAALCRQRSSGRSRLGTDWAGRDHTDFVGFIRTYIAAHPNTKSSTELLFLLDQIVQADCDALALFVAPDTDGKLWWTKAAQPDAYAVGTRAAEEWSAADAANAPVYGSFLARIDGILRAGRVAPVSAAVSPSVHHAIDRILDDVEVRWLMTSSTRLRKFGYTYDSY